ncbi:hypothetical protein GGS20DRAFT_584618 [Poronia punctata]|nr:hypothetical protein GGS20DRAFT_584618 [Poronia punctata]
MADRNPNNVPSNGRPRINQAQLPPPPAPGTPGLHYPPPPQPFPPNAPGMNYYGQHQSPVNNAYVQHHSPANNAYVQHYSPANNAYVQHQGLASSGYPPYQVPVYNAYQQHHVPVDNAYQQHHVPVNNAYQQHQVPVGNTYHHIQGPFRNDYQQSHAPATNSYQQSHAPVDNGHEYQSGTYVPPVHYQRYNQPANNPYVYNPNGYQGTLPAPAAYPTQPQVPFNGPLNGNSTYNTLPHQNFPNNSMGRGSTHRNSFPGHRRQNSLRLSSPNRTLPRTHYRNRNSVGQHTSPIGQGSSPNHNSNSRNNHSRNESGSIDNNNNPTTEPVANSSPSSSVQKANKNKKKKKKMTKGKRKGKGKKQQQQQAAANVTNQNPAASSSAFPTPADPAGPAAAQAQSSDQEKGIVDAVAVPTTAGREEVNGDTTVSAASASASASASSLSRYATYDIIAAETHLFNEENANAATTSHIPVPAAQEGEDDRNRVGDIYDLLIVGLTTLYPGDDEYLVREFLKGTNPELTQDFVRTLFEQVEHKSKELVNAMDAWVKKYAQEEDDMAFPLMLDARGMMSHPGAPGQARDDEEEEDGEMMGLDEVDALMECQNALQKMMEGVQDMEMDIE